MNVAVLGASIKESRYSNLAVKALKDAGHNVFPVHKVYKEVHGIKTFDSVLSINEKIHTLSVYICKEASNLLMDDILKLKLQRIIMNPGAENYDLKEKAEQMGIEIVFNCTLVMLSVGVF